MYILKLLRSSYSCNNRIITCCFAVAGFPIQRSQAAYHQVRVAERVGPDCHTPASNKQAKDEVVERDLQNSTARVCKGMCVKEDVIIQKLPHDVFKGTKIKNLLDELKRGPGDRTSAYPWEVNSVIFTSQYHSGFQNNSVYL